MYICTNKLRWESYSTKGSEGENLPPTRGAIVQHFRRAWLAAVIGKSYTTPAPTIPPPKDNGWYKEEERLRPVTSLILPAPASIIELVKCSCKGECLKKGCSCNKNNLLCSPMCKCKDLCKNKPPRTDDYDLSMTNYQVMMKNSENIHVPWCVYHYFMIVLFTITKSILNAVQLDFSFNLVCVKLLELNALYKIFR